MFGLSLIPPEVGAVEVLVGLEKTGIIHNKIKPEMKW